jgi:hypothetical protein
VNNDQLTFGMLHLIPRYIKRKLDLNDKNIASEFIDQNVKYIKIKSINLCMKF